MKTAPTDRSSSLYLWALRISAARGKFWERQRGVTPETSADWLKVFANDEPGVQFCISPVEPRVPLPAEEEVA